LCAQQVILVKNNDTRYVKLNLPKRLKLVYRTDSFTREFKCKAIAYSFPYMTVKEGYDTLSLDVRNVVSIRYTTRFIPLRYLLAFVAAELIAVNIVITVSDAPFAAGFVPLPVAACYFLIASTHRTLDTYYTWSFLDYSKSPPFHLH
jgi:hypothetical protein